MQQPAARQARGWSMLRVLLHAPACLACAHLASLRCPFCVQVRLLELDPFALGPRGRDASDGGSPLLGSASSSSDDEEWDEEEEDESEEEEEEEEEGESSGSEGEEGSSGSEEGDESEVLAHG